MLNCNTMWEGSLLEDGRVIKSNAVTSIRKPCPKDAISHKELYIHSKVVGVELYHHIDEAQDSEEDCLKEKRKSNDPTFCQRIKDANDPGNCLQGCSLLHLACQCGNVVLIELLIQFGADINMRDFHGRTPWHHCISTGNNVFAKHLLRRGARPSIKDGGGLSALEKAMEMGAITDDELFIMLSES